MSPKSVDFVGEEKQEPTTETQRKKERSALFVLLADAGVIALSVVEQEHSAACF